MNKKTSRYANRELSWLEFNQRVLDEAMDEQVPLLERLFFLAVTASNLDEFFMVRVGGLELLRASGVTKRDPAGLSPTRQLQDIRRRVTVMAADQYRCWTEHLAPALENAGIRLVRFGRESGSIPESVRTLFHAEIFPVVTPMMLAATTLAPLIQNQEVYVAVALAAPAGKKGKREYAAIPVSRCGERLRPLPGEGTERAFVRVEDVVMAFAEDFFPGHEVVETAPFRITRNADIMPDEEFAEDLVREMEKILSSRKKSRCVRLELGADASKEMEAFLTGLLETPGEFVYRYAGPLDLTGLLPLGSLEEYPDLRYPPLPPQPSPTLDPRKSVFDQVAKQDVLLSHPFESFEPVVRFVEEAADDPQVLAIKQILYRASPDSRIVEALRRAALNGKYVTAVVELRARFDEARNIAWARALEVAGVQVIYGIRRLKIHGKICLVVRREPAGIVRYVHFGTGNYNEKTARLYTDVGLFTCAPELGKDASVFFNVVAGRSEPVPYLKLEQSPWGLRRQLLELIDAEVARKRRGQKACIMAKMNALVDPEIIDALYTASGAGVEILLNVRGICCLRPGVKGLSDHIRVVSIIDRFLEHSRIFCFHHGGAKKVFISSADWMTRNLSRRVEIMTPVEDKACKRRLLQILEVCFSDNVKARDILQDGGYRRVDAGGRKKRIRAQERLYELACQSAAWNRTGRRVVFEPHRPPRGRGEG